MGQAMLKGPKDLNHTAFNIVDLATGTSTSKIVAQTKKGRTARKATLTPEQQSVIAKKAAAARWAK
jgi:hypothetical protein